MSRRFPAKLRIVPPAVALLALVAPAAGFACGSAGYTYAGVQASRTTYGVGARLTTTAEPTVQGGHVAGWVGVGGVGQGPRGSSEWIQVGFSAFPGSTESNLYYEVARPRSTPVYTEIAAALPIGLTRSVAVLEMAHRRDWWRVWVNGNAVGSPVHLPQSHAAWRPIATAESWGGGSPACNGFSYSFERVSVASAPGGGWRPLSNSYSFHNAGYQVIRRAAASFIATTHADSGRGPAGVTP